MPAHAKTKTSDATFKSFNSGSESANAAFKTANAGFKQLKQLSCQHVHDLVGGNGNCF